jgi:hypothetical protein
MSRLTPAGDRHDHRLVVRVALVSAALLAWLFLPAMGGASATSSAAASATTSAANSAATSATTFAVGASQVDITPPASDTTLGEQLDDSDFVPYCGTSPSQVAQLWPGKRLFAFEDPYVDLKGAGRYVPGDPYCDADATHRYEAPYIAGGSGQNRWPLTSADADPAYNPPGSSTTFPAPACPGSSPAPLTSPCSSPDAINADAVVFERAGQRVAMVSVDSIGMFDSTMDQIRSDVHALGDHDLSPGDIFISSTHDESAPDPIGLWGPDLSGEPSPADQANGALPVGISSGVDDYYMKWMASQVAKAIVEADTPPGGAGPLGTASAQQGLQPARLRVTTARMPANQQSCWSSYPFVDTDLMPVMQGVSTSGRVVFTLVNVGTHDETLGFSGDPAYTSMLSGDWAGRLRESLETDYPGSIGMEMAGLVGSVETPALYSEGTQVLQVPGAFHRVPGNPTNGCSSVYPEPKGSSGSAATPYTDALSYVFANGKSVADTTSAALVHSSSEVSPRDVVGQTKRVCLQLENNLFLAAFAADLFPDRPAYADPNCTVGLALSGSVTTGPGAAGSSTAGLHTSAPAFIDSEVGVVSLGPVQITYSPGEIFPFTEVGGYVDSSQMPFPTDCFLPGSSDPSNPAAGDYTCGAPLPMTPDVSAEMTGHYRFLAGLGEDMVGYLFPPGNFVGSQGETFEEPWSLYEETSSTGNDRFGYGHADDAESVGPYAGLSLTDALSNLLSQDGTGDEVLPGLYVDGAGRLCDSPFPASSPYDSGDAAGSWVTGCKGFTGAVGVVVVEPGGTRKTVEIGDSPGDASSWATYFGTRDSGTPGTTYSYSTATRGVVVDGKPLIVDVFSGASALQTGPA